MAQRRMFSKTITSSSSFLMMPPTSRLLYYDLGMNADDDGFCEHYVIMKMTDAKPDDLKVLQVKGFVKVFDEKVLVILSWKENNYISKDRYSPSKYLSVYKKELKLLSEECRQDVDKMYTECRQDVDAGKDRLGKDRLGEDCGSETSPPPLKEENKTHKECVALIDYFVSEYQRLISKSPPIFNWAISIKNTKPYLKSLGLEKMKTLVDKYFSSDDQFYKKVGWGLDVFLKATTLNSLN